MVAYKGFQKLFLKNFESGSLICQAIDKTMKRENPEIELITQACHFKSLCQLLDLPFTLVCQISNQPYTNVLLSCH